MERGKESMGPSDAGQRRDNMGELSPDRAGHTVEVDTEYSYEQMKTYQRFRGRYSRLFVLTLAAAITVFSVVDFIHRWISNTRGNEPGNLLYSTCLCLGLLAFLYLWQNGNLYSRRQFEMASRLMGGRQHQVFRNSDFCIWSNPSGSPAQMICSYTDLDKVWETPAMFYLLQQNHRIFLVEKQAFKIGTPAELAEIFKEHLGKRYVYAPGFH